LIDINRSLFISVFVYKIINVDSIFHSKNMYLIITKHFSENHLYFKQNFLIPKPH